MFMWSNCCIFYASRTRKGCHNDANLTRISPTTDFLYQNKLYQLNANLFFVPDKISKNKQFFSSSPHSQQTSLRLSEQIIERCFSLTTLLTNSAREITLNSLKSTQKSIHFPTSVPTVKGFLWRKVRKTYNCMHSYPSLGLNVCFSCKQGIFIRRTTTPYTCYLSRVGGKEGRRP